MEVGRKGVNSALKVNLQDVREQYERSLKRLQEANNETILGLAKKRLTVLLGGDAK